MKRLHYSVLFFLTACHTPVFFEKNMSIGVLNGQRGIKYYSVEGSNGWVSITDENSMAEQPQSSTLIFLQNGIDVQYVHVNDSLRFTMEFRHGRLARSYMSNSKTCLVDGLVSFYNHSGKIQCVAEYRSGQFAKLIYASSVKYARRALNLPVLKTCSRVDSNRAL